MVSDQLSHIPVGEVQLFFCTDVDETINTFAIGKAFSAATDKALKVVVQPWASLPDQEQLLVDVIDHLTEIALATWPFWYGQTTANPLGSAIPPNLDASLLNPQGLKTRQAISPAWAKAAAQACNAGLPPRVRGFTRGQQLSQLALAIDPGNLLIILAVHDSQPLPHRLLGLAKVAIWMATTTAGRMAIFAPTTLSTCPELESLGYRAVTLLDQMPPPVAKTDETGKSAIWYLQGQPHPFSPGEQLLARHLRQDRELAPLFEFNQPVSTVCQSNYWVDLLWRVGRLVVEIDGYRIHSCRSAFHQDRNRDYELLLSGYHVLRLPHDEVIEDVTGVIQKIRNVVCQFKNNRESFQK